MFWISRHPEIDANDRALLEFSEARSEAVSIWKGEQRRDANSRMAGGHFNQPLHLAGEKEWEQWLQQIEDVDQDSGLAFQNTGVSSSIHLIMCGRTSSSLSKMPFSENLLAQIMNKLKIHRSIIRAINRNTICIFSRMICDSGSKATSARSIVYTCRTAESWEEDMALSVTFIPDTLTTNAIWFGCNLKERYIHGYKLTDSAMITGRLSNFDGELFHPMMLPTIFAEFERDRHANLVRKSNTQFVQRIIDIESGNETLYGVQQVHRGNRQSVEKNCPPSGTNSFFTDMKGRVGSFLSGKTLSASSTFNNSQASEIFHKGSDSGNSEDAESCAMLWIKISHLKNGLASWKTQLLKMIDHTRELEHINFGIESAISTKNWNSKREWLKGCGKRIEERLCELVDEYDHFTRECDHIMAGMSLATQLDLSNIGRQDARLNENISRNSLAVAEIAQRDGSLMKSIAVLGMIYLPATFVCTFFSMGFFQWKSQNNTTAVSPDVWIFALVAVAFTLVTIGIFLACTMNRDTKVRAKLHLV